MQKVPVSASAVIQRAKRLFKVEGEVLKTAREGGKAHSLGPFYSVDTNQNVIQRSNLNITDLATMVLKPHEELQN